MHIFARQSEMKNDSDASPSKCALLRSHLAEDAKQNKEPANTNH